MTRILVSLFILLAASPAQADSKFEKAGQVYGQCVGEKTYPHLTTVASLNCQVLDLSSRIAEGECEKERTYWLSFIPRDQQPIFLEMSHQLMMNEFQKVLGLQGCVAKTSTY